MMDKRIILAAAVALMLLTAVDAAYQAVNCASVHACGASTTPSVKCLHDSAGNPDAKDCGVACAKACGQSTGETAPFTVANVMGECATRCGGEACSTYPLGVFDALTCAITPSDSCTCYEACVGTCVSNTEFCKAFTLLQMIAGVIVILVLIINGIKFMISEDAHSREEAKSGVWYGLVGGLVVLISPYLVAAIMGISMCT
jgi:hypothetical protein